MAQSRGLVWVTLPKTFDPLPRRWVVERTFAWIGRYRRMSKDYEYLTTSSEAMVYLTMLRLMLTRLAKQNAKQFIKSTEKRAASLFVQPLLISSEIDKLPPLPL